MDSRKVRRHEKDQKQLPQPATLLKKETLPQVFSCEFCEISKNAVSNRTPPVAATERWKIVKPITMQRIFFYTSHHYVRNVIKVFFYKQLFCGC